VHGPRFVRDRKSARYVFAERMKPGEDKFPNGERLAKPAERGFNFVTNSYKSFVIYDKNIRWLAIMNMTFVAVGIWFAVRFCSGFLLYLLVAFLGLFSLFWIRDLLFGMKLRLVSDGRLLQWQDRKKTGSVPLAEIKKILIGVSKPVQAGDSVVSWTYVTLQLTSGAKHELPPNLANGLCAWKWKKLKELVAHLRTLSEVKVEPIDIPGTSVHGWEDDQKF
jgi:hypothetical protein